VPPFFEPAFPDPHVRSELWRQTRLEWLDSHVPASFRYAVLDALAERSPWPWAAVAEAAHDMPAQGPASLERAHEAWPAPNTALYGEVLALTLQLLSDGADDEVRNRLVASLGERHYAALVGMLSYFETCRMFAQAHPGLTSAAGSPWRRSGDPQKLAVAEIDGAGSVTSFSPVAEELFGSRAPAVVGHPLTDLFAAEGRDAVVRFVDEFRELEVAPVREQSFRVVGQRHDGTTFDATLRIANRGRDGELGAMTAMIDPSAAQHLPEPAEAGGHAAQAQLAFEGAPVGMALVTLEPGGGAGVITEVNRALPVITGRDASELVGASIADLTDPADADLDADLFAKLLAGEIPSYEVTKRFRGPAGELFWGELSVSLIRDEQRREPKYLVVQLADISERRRVEDALRTSWDRSASVFDEAPIGMGIATLDDRWVQVNDALCETLGYAEADLLSMPASQLVPPDEIETIQRYLRQLLAGEVLGYHVETRAVRANGQTMWVQVSVSLIHDYEGAPAYVFAEVQDISERKRLEEELEQGALLDAVTGLPSRTLLFDRLEQARARLERSGAPFAVMFAAAEGPDAVAARLGWERGDAALTELAARMLAAVRSGDTVARYGADEFVILCEDLENDEEATTIAARILELGRFKVGDQKSAVQMSLTLGFTVAASREDTAAGLVERADAAMHLARGQKLGYQEYCESS
jgi:PAS domain S-box-containing protein/diguanylate cyclase (GGDEF)-like protein